jgi:hypothetical protein
MSRPSLDPPAGFLDRPAARVLALAVLLACAAALAWMHRADLFPAAAGPGAAGDPAAACIAQRSADIDRMQDDGVIDASQAALFKSRAEALCRSQAGG